MSGTAAGVGLALLSALSFAASNLFITRTGTSKGDKGVLFSVLVTMVLSGLLFLALEAGRTRWSGTVGDIAGLGWFALAGLTAMVFGRTLVYTSIRRLGVARASAVKRLNPFFSVLLAALFLGERIGGWDALGMAAIAAALGLLIRDSLAKRRTAGTATPGAYLFGAGSAVAYAISYIARKLGLDLFDAPALGTFVSAAAGFSAFAVIALVSPAYRPMFTGLFRDLDRWIVLAALAVSGGQILMFAALAQAPVTLVVMVASLEVFMAVILSAVIFRLEPLPDAGVLGAAALATVGVVLVAAG